MYGSTSWLYAERQEDVPEHLAEKYEQQAATMWDRFYKRNEDRFYKDRHYFDREVTQLNPARLLLPWLAGASVAEPFAPGAFLCSFRSCATALRPWWRCACPHDGSKQPHVFMLLPGAALQPSCAHPCTLPARPAPPFTMSSPLVQVGCGVGNTVFPLLELNPSLKVYCCDFAPSAIELVKQHPGYASGALP